MKKICFMLACLLLISNTPSFAMKIIVNDTNSRIVPSRSTSHYESDLDAAYHAQKGQSQVEEEQFFEEPQQEELNEEFANEEHNEEFQEEQQEGNPEEFNEEVANEENPEEFIEENNEEPVTYVRKNLTEEEINNLSEDFRNELIGTYWNYAELEAQRAYEQQMAMEEEQRMLEEQRAMEEQMAMEAEQAQEAQPEEIVEEPMPEEIAEEPVQEEIADINDEFNEYMLKKRGSREAADYYMIDSIKDPNVAIPSGYPQ